MTEPKPTDYLAAAIIYLIVDGEIGKQGLTADSIASMLAARYNFDVSVKTAENVLGQVEQLELLSLTDDPFGGTYYSAPFNFRDKVAHFRFVDGTHPIAVVLDRFMNGPPEWMVKALSSVRFVDALASQLLTDTSDIPELQTFDAGPRENQVDSSAWTGLPSNFVLTSGKQEVLIGLLEEAERGLDTAGAGNSEKAMARAFIIAAKTLADAPDPPVDIIWELIQRANALSGIASLFVSIIALFTVAAH